MDGLNEPRQIVPWSTIAADPDVQKLDAADYDQLRRNYFDNVIAPELPAGEIEGVWTEFNASTSRNFVGDIKAGAKRLGIMSPSAPPNLAPDIANEADRQSRIGAEEATRRPLMAPPSLAPVPPALQDARDQARIQVLQNEARNPADEASVARELATFPPEAQQRAQTPFDPEGDGYDMDTARAAGLQPDATGHWPSRDPATGTILKGRKHPTWALTEQGERAAGHAIAKDASGRYVSQPSVPLEGTPFSMPAPERQAIEGMIAQAERDVASMAPDLAAEEIVVEAPPVPPKGTPGYREWLASLSPEDRAAVEADDRAFGLGEVKAQAGLSPGYFLRRPSPPEEGPPKAPLSESVASLWDRFSVSVTALGPQTGYAVTESNLQALRDRVAGMEKRVAERGASFGALGMDTLRAELATAKTELAEKEAGLTAQTADWKRQVDEFTRLRAEVTPKNESFAGEVLGTMAESSPSMLAGLLTLAITKNPVLAAEVGGAAGAGQEGVTAYAEARSANAPVSRAQATAVINGLIERFADVLQIKALTREGKDLLSRLLSGYATAVPSEMAAEGLQAANESLQYNDQMTVGEVLHRIAVAGGAAAATTTIAAPAVQMMDRMKKPEGLRTEPPRQAPPAEPKVEPVGKTTRVEPELRTEAAVRPTPEEPTVQTEPVQFIDEPAMTVPETKGPDEPTLKTVPDVDAPPPSDIEAAAQPLQPLFTESAEDLLSTDVPHETVDAAANEAATSPQNDLPEPTQAQKDAGNYKLGHTRLHGLDISIENPAGSDRKGIGEDGKPWSARLAAHYGYIRRTEGADGDHVDVFIGNNHQSDNVYVIDQRNPKTGKFDESKVLLSFASRDEALNAYRNSYTDNANKRIMSLSETNVAGLKNWLDSGDTKKPFDWERRHVWTHAERSAPTKPDAAVQTLAEREGSVPQSQESVLPQLRGQGDSAVPGVGSEFPGVQSGRRTAPESGTQFGPEGQQRPLPAGQREVVNQEGTGAQHAQKPTVDAQRGDKTADSMGGADRIGAVDAPVSAQSGRNDGGPSVDNGQTPRQEATGLAPDEPLKLYKSADRAKLEAKKLTRLGAPSKVVPHPSGSGYAVVEREIVPRSEAQKANDARLKQARNTVNPERDSLYSAIGKLGGINRDQVKAEWGIDPKDTLNSGVIGKPVLKRDGGLTIDGMVEALAQFGYLKLDENGKAEMTELEELFGRELRGEKVYAPQALERMAAAQADRDFEAQPGNPIPEADFTDEELVQDGYNDLSPEEQVALDEFVADATVKLGDATIQAVKERVWDEAGNMHPRVYAAALRKAIDEEFQQAQSRKPGEGPQGGAQPDFAPRPEVGPIGGESASPGQGSAVQGLQTEVDRRTDLAQRKRVSEMSPEEARAALLTHELTGLPNRRAFEESPKKKFKASVDVDALKWANDNMGHASGDKMLQAFGAALKESGAEVFHISGDEFVIQADDEAQLDAVAADVGQRVAAVEIELTRPDGTVVRKTGIGFSYGTGENLETAEERLQADKARREASGARPRRGERPAGVVEIPAQGQPDNQGEPQGVNLPAVRQRLFVGRGGQRFEVESLEDASRKWDQYRERSGAGASELGSDMRIYDEAGKEVARISYNGRVWPPGEWKEGMKLLYDPYSHGELSHPENKFETPRPALDLAAPSEAGLKATEAAKQRADEEKSKRDAAPPANEFNLTGSDRAADRAAAAGQMELAPTKSVADMSAAELLRAAVAKMDEAAKPPKAPANTLAGHDDLIERAREGNTTPEELKAGFEAMVANADAIKAELGKLTKEALNKRMGGRRSSSDTKARMIGMAYTDLLADFTLGEGYSYTFGKGGPETGIRTVVEKITPETIANFSERVKKARADRAARFQGYKKALENPETLEEFDTFTKLRKDGEAGLTPEQQARYDELRALAGREKRTEELTRRATVQAADEKVGAKIIETKHTRDGYDLFVVQLEKRVDREDYNRLNNAAKKLGGWYSSFKGNGAVPGFQFKTRESAEAFQKLASEGDTAAVQEVAVERKETKREAKKNAAAEKLAEMADKLESAGQESMSADRLTNTARRARMASSAEAKAAGDIALARTMRNLSEAIESRTATHLDGIRTKAQVEMLGHLAERAKQERLHEQYPDYTQYERHKDRPVEAEDIVKIKSPWAFDARRADLYDAVNSLANKKNSKMLQGQLRRLAETARNDDEWITVPRSVVEAAIDKITDSYGYPWHWASKLETVKRLESAGIEDMPMLRAALREFVKYRSERPKADRVKELERALAGNPGVGIDFFPTPEALAMRMAEALNVKAGMTVLEPSAGKGNLADAVREIEPEAEIETVEQSATLREILQAKGYPLVGHDFMDFQPEEQYDRIIMNPPFSDGRDADHVRKAYGHLKPGGRLVAITGEGIFFRGDKKATEFRSWFESLGGESEQLAGAFTDKREVKTTGVASRMLILDKPPEEPRMERAQAPRTEGLSVSAVQPHVDRITAQWKNAPGIKAVATVDDLPKKWREWVESKGATGDVQALYVPEERRVYLIADQLASPAELEFVLFHETLGHSGLRGFLTGDRYKVEMRKAYNTNKNVRAAADKLIAQYSYDQDLATEEALADMAGKGQSFGIIRRLLVALQAALRKIGLGRVADFLEGMSDAEASALLAEARKFVTDGPHVYTADMAPALSRNAPIFYSELAAQIAGHKMQSAPAAQWKATIANLPGVKKDEVEWSGVNEWLDMWVKSDKIPKDVVLTYLAQNGVKVEETVLGGGDSETLATSEVNILRVELDALGYDVVDDQIEETFGVRRRSDHKLFSDSDAAETDRNFGGPLSELGREVARRVERLGEILEIRADRYADREPTDTKFETYTLPGGKNYRELLLTLPGHGSSTDYKDIAEDMGVEIVPDVDESWADAFRRQTVGVRNTIAAEYAKRSGSEPQFHSSHFDQPNILAHVRFNERTDADGKRVLFIEEIQSDWAQKGKRERFNTPEAEAAAKKAKDAVSDYVNKLNDKYDENHSLQRILAKATHEEQDEFERLQSASERLYKGGGVPTAPFVQKTEAWVGLAIKRMIRYAAENGFDRVAWTTGEQQADRYSLDKHISALRLIDAWAKYPTQRAGHVNTRRGVSAEKPLLLVAYDKAGNVVIEKGVNEKELPDIIGKEAAKRLLESERLDKYERSLTGVQLRVGGEGMRAFYDKIVPNVANDVLKKMGGERVGLVRLSKDDEAVKITAAEAKEIALDLINGRTDVDEFNEEWEQNLSVDDIPGADPYRMPQLVGGLADRIRRASAPQKRSKQPGFDLTPAMRERAMEGMPLFSRAGQRAGAAPRESVLDAYRRIARRAINALDRIADPFVTLPDRKAFMAKRGLTQGLIDNTNDLTKAIRKALIPATAADRKAVFAYLITSGATTDAITEPKIQQAARELKDLIRRVGDELVRRGMLDEETRRDSYLPQVYLKYLLDTKDFRAMGAGKKPSSMSYLLKRKYEMKASPDGKVSLIERDTGLVVPDETILSLGPVTDPAFLSGLAVARPLRDIALLDWLEDISKNEHWILPGSTLKWDRKKVSAYWLKEEAARIRKQARYYGEADGAKALAMAQKMDAAADDALEGMPADRERFRQMPNTPRMGHMRGIWVREEIYNDIQGINDIIPTHPGWAQRIFGYGGEGTKAVQIWKTLKVPLNLPGQVRNFGSNAVLLNLSGVPVRSLARLIPKAIDELMHDGTHWKIAKKYGIRNSTFSAQELQRLKTEYLEIQRQAGDLNIFGLTTLLAKKTANYAGDIYQLTEALFKTVKIIHEMDNGADEATAVDEAQKWLFDYSNVPKAVRYLRGSPVGVPFITFPAKVLPRLVETAALHPLRYLPWAGLYFGLQYGLAALLDVDYDDLEKLKKAMPEWIQKAGHAVLLPFKDELGRWQVVDLGYFMPWTYWTTLGKDIGRGEIGEAFKDTGAVAGPMVDLATAWRTGIDPFTKREIANPADPAGAQMMAWMNYHWSLAAPPMLTDRGTLGKAIEAYRGETNRFGDPRRTPSQAALSLFGVNLHAIEPEQTRAANITRMEREIQDTMQRVKSLLTDRSLTEEQRTRIKDRYTEELKRRRDELSKYMADSKIDPKLATGN